MPPSRKQGGRRPERLLARIAEPLFVWVDGEGLVFANPGFEALDRGEGERAGDEPGLSREDLAPPLEVWTGQHASRLVVTVQPDGRREIRAVDYWPFRGSSGQVGLALCVVRLPEQAPVHAASESTRLRDELLTVREEALRRHGCDLLVGRGDFHERLGKQLELGRSSKVVALVVGPAGSGRSHVARMLRESSGSGFRALNCRSLPEDLLEKELRGIVAGSESDARQQTVVLDHVDELPRDLQAELAHWLAASPGRGRLRWVATCGPEPEGLVRNGVPRGDLFHLLSPLRIELRPLRERLEELPLFAQHFLERQGLEGGARRESFEQAALDALMVYDWPGNLAELERVVQAAHARAEGPMITVRDIPAVIRGEMGHAYPPPPAAAAAEALGLDETLLRLERVLIERALRRSRGNKSKAAQMLGISRPRLHRRIEELGLEGGQAAGEAGPS